MIYKSWQLITQGCLLSGAIKTGLSKYSTVKKSNCDECGMSNCRKLSSQSCPCSKLSEVGAVFLLLIELLGLKSCQNER